MTLGHDDSTINIVMAIIISIIITQYIELQSKNDPRPHCTRDYVKFGMCFFICDLRDMQTTLVTRVFSPDIRGWNILVENYDICDKDDIECEQYGRVTVSYFHC